MGRLFLPSNQLSSPLFDFSAVFSFIGDIMAIQTNRRDFWCSTPYFMFPGFGRCFFRITMEDKNFPEKCEKCGNYYGWTGIK
jgi:hypothetical protein